MNYIVIDFEFNQSFEFKDGNPTILNEACPFEIMQIGAVKLDNNFQIITMFSTFVRPTLYTRLHPFVEKLTGIRRNDLRKSPLYSEAYSDFFDFIGSDEVVLCCWGQDDLKILYQNLKYFKQDLTVFNNYFINIQSSANILLGSNPSESISLKNAVLKLGIIQNSTFHNALNDAYYTTLIFKMLNPSSIPYESIDIVAFSKLSARKKVRTKALYDYFEKRLAKPLTEDEKNMIFLSYTFGLKNKFGK